MKKIFAPFMMGLTLAFCAIPLPAPAQTIAVTLPAISAYAKVLHKINPHLPHWQSDELARRVLVNANRFKLDANLLVALVTVESAWRTHARSRVGAVGLGQLMPATASRMGVNPRNADQNLRGAARYFSTLLERFSSSPHQYALATAAYNAGPRAVTSYGGIPPYAETRHYVVKVLRTWKHIARVVKIPADTSAYVAPAQHPSAPDAAYWTQR